MPSPSEPTPEQMLEAMGRAGRAHISVSRGALPFVVPCRVRVVAGDLVVVTSHPSVTRGAQRRDIAAVQVEALIDGVCWSLSVTGPLTLLDAAAGHPIELDADRAHAVGQAFAGGPMSDRSAAPSDDAAASGVVTALVVPSREALFSAECLSSAHGHRVDPLLRSGLAERA